MLKDIAMQYVQVNMEQYCDKNKQIWKQNQQLLVMKMLHVLYCSTVFKQLDSGSQSTYTLCLRRW